jgi:hypothetical protein
VPNFNPKPIPNPKFLNPPNKYVNIHCSDFSVFQKLSNLQDCQKLMKSMGMLW